MRRRNLLLGIVAAMGCAAVSAQETLQRSPDAVATLNVCSAAMGSATVAGDVVAEGSLRRYFGRNDSQFIETPTVFKNKGAAQSRIELGAPADRVQVINGSSGHSIREGARTRISYHATAYFRPEQLAPALCSLELGRSNATITLLGTEDVRGRMVSHVRVVSGDDAADQMLSEYHLYIDRLTGLLLKTRNYVFDPDAIENHSVWEVYYSDFRRVGSAIFPFHIERHIDGQRHS